MWHTKKSKKGMFDRMAKAGMGWSEMTAKWSKKKPKMMK